MCAARNNRIEVVDFLIDTLEDTRADAVDVDGQTALFHAAMGGHVTIVKRLIDLGANLDKRNKVSRKESAFRKMSRINKVIKTIPPRFPSGFHRILSFDEVSVFNREGCLSWGRVCSFGQSVSFTPTINN
jgi:ankyrin repeat protein